MTNTYLSAASNNPSAAKLMEHYAAFFQAQKQQLEARKEGYISDAFVQAFQDRYALDRVEQIRPTEDCRLEELLAHFHEDLFGSEARLIIENSSRPLSHYEAIAAYEHKLFKLNGGSSPSKRQLYHSRSLEGASKLKNTAYDSYKSLTQYLNRFFMYQLSEQKQLAILRAVFKLEDYYQPYTAVDAKVSQELWAFLNPDPRVARGQLVPPYAQRVAKNSAEYSRRKVNAFVSILFQVSVSDELLFHSKTHEPLSYFQFRVLAYVRNPEFNFAAFRDFLRELLNEAEEQTHTEPADPLLFQVLPLFVSQVVAPREVDHLIQTHRLVAGLWKNGSKFLNTYELHNEEHAVELIKNCVQVIQLFSFLQLEKRDYYILFLACYLHDISMVIHPKLTDYLGDKEKLNLIYTDFISKNMEGESMQKNLLSAFNEIYYFFENKMHKNHAFASADLIREYAYSHLSFVSFSSLEYVAKVAEAHGKNGEEIYGLKSPANASLFSMKYMMIILRLANLLDLSKEGINSYLLKENVPYMAPKSQFNWVSQLITEGSKISVEYADPASSKGLIQEIITLEIDINTANRTLISGKKKCTGYKMVNKGSSLHFELKDYDFECSHKKCPFICRWMTEKHHDLLQELVYLKEYLSNFSDRLFDTQIQVHFNCQEQNKLDSTYFDIVSKYIN